MAATYFFTVLEGRSPRSTANKSGVRRGSASWLTDSCLLPVRIQDELVSQPYGVGLGPHKTGTSEPHLQIDWGVGD